jgi:hypothetical protein
MVWKTTKEEIPKIKPLLEKILKEFSVKWMIITTVVSAYLLFLSSLLNSLEAHRPS